MCIIGLEQGQITPNIVVSKTYIKTFFRFLLLSTSNVRMSEGTFCHVEVHISML